MPEHIVHDEPIGVKWEVANLLTHRMYIVRMEQEDGSSLFKITKGDGAFAFNKKTGEFEYEGLPSTRGKDHATLYRYETFEKAYGIAKKIATIWKKKFPLLIERIKKNQEKIMTEKNNMTTTVTEDDVKVKDAEVEAPEKKKIVYQFPSHNDEDNPGLVGSRSFTDYFADLRKSWGRAYAHESRNGWSRGYPKSAMLDDSFKLRGSVVEIMTAFKETNPHESSHEEFLNGIQQLFIDLSNVYRIPHPSVRHKGDWEGPSARSYYTAHGITLSGKPSVITALHEYAHARGYGEVGAIWWSVNTFKLIWPDKFKKLRAAKNLPYSPKASH